MRAKLKTGKAQGLDGIPNEVLRKIIEVYPVMLLETLLLFSEQCRK